jgi:peptidyl-prolyl cis-trans isomerase C
MIDRRLFPSRRTALLAALLAPGLAAFMLPANPLSAATKPGAADTMLAVYDGGVVTPTEFSRAWESLAPTEYPPGNPLTSRQAYLGSIVGRKLLAREALKRPIVLTPAETAEIERQRDLMVQNALFADLTKDLPRPTAEDLDRLRRMKTSLAEIRFVTFKDWDRARAWYARLNAGTPNSALDAAMRREGADLAQADSFRYVAAEQIPDSLAQIIWKLRPGQVSEIHEFAGQPTVIQLRRVLARPIPTGQVSDLEGDYQRRIFTRVREEFRMKIAADVKRTFDEDGMAFLLREQLKLPPRNDIDTTTGMPIFQATMKLPNIAPADTGRVLARAGGRAFTIRDYLAYWERVQAYERPEVRERSSLEGVVDRIALAPELTRLGHERGLDRDPKLLERLDRMREGYAVDHYFVDEIVSKVKLDEAGLKKLFAADPGHYDDRASISSHIIVVDRRSLADSLMAKLKAGASFSDLARQYSTEGESGKRGGDIGIQYYGTQKNVGLEDAMFATAVAEVGGPEQTPEGWVLWRIDAKTPGLKRSFEEARSMVERDYRVLEADRLLDVRLAKLKKEAHVKLYPERITEKLGSEGPWDN